MFIQFYLKYDERTLFNIQSVIIKSQCRVIGQTEASYSVLLSPISGTTWHDKDPWIRTMKIGSANTMQMNEPTLSFTFSFDHEINYQPPAWLATKLIGHFHPDFCLTYYAKS